MNISLKALQVVLAIFLAPIISLLANEPVGERGDLEKIRFEGVESYSIDSIRRGLLMSGEYMIASHPRADLQQFEEQLVDAIRRGYQSGGFPDIEVRLKRDPQTQDLVVEVDEGKRFTKGSLSVQGVSDELREQIVSRVTGSVEVESSTRRSYLKRIRSNFAEATGTLAAKRQPSQDPGELPQEAAAPDTGKKDDAKPNWDLRGSSEITYQLDGQILNSFGYPVEVPTGSAEDGDQSFELLAANSQDFDRWKTGEEFSFSSSSKGPWMLVLRGTLAELGYQTAQMEMQLERNDAEGTVDLNVEIGEIGQPATLGEIRVEGAEINSESETLEYLGLKSGQKLSRAMLEEAELRLIESGRYLAHRLVLQPRTTDASERPVDLLLQVAEYPDAPPLDESLSPKQRALIDFMSWFSHLPEGGDDLILRWDRIETDLNESKPGEPDFLVLPAGRFVVSPNNGLMLVIGNGLDSGPLFDPDKPEEGQSFSVLEFSNRANALVTGSASGIQRWESPAYNGTISFNLLGRPNGRDPGENFMTVDFGTAFQSQRKEGSKGPIWLDMFAAPVFAIHETIYDADRWSEVEPGVLMRGDATHHVKLDALSGRLIEAIVEQDGIEITIVSEAGAFQRYRKQLESLTVDVENEYDAEAPLQSFIALAKEQVLASDLVAGRLDGPERELVEKLAEALLVADVFDLIADPVTAWLGAGVEPSEAFSVPMRLETALNTNQLMSSMAALMLSSANQALPEGSWMSSLVREVIYAAGGNRQHLDEAVAELTNGDSPIGPFGYLVASELFKMVKSPASDRLLLAGYGQLSEAAFRRDWEPLLAGETQDQRGLLSLVEAIVNLVPDSDVGDDRPLPAIDPGALRKAIELHRDGDREGAVKLLEPIAAKFWNQGAGDSLTRKFEDRLGLSGIDKKAVAVVVNGEPIRHLDVARAVLLEAVTPAVDLDRSEREQQAVEELVDRKLIYLDFVRKGGAIEDAHLEASVDRFLKSIAGGDRDVAVQMMTSVGISVDDLKPIYRELMVDAYMRQEARSPDLETQREYFHAHREEFVAPRAVELEMISMPVSQKNREQMSAVRKKIVGGEDFAEMARQFSTDFKSEEGGYFGWTKEGEINAVIMKRALKLQAGELGKVFEDQGQYRLLRVKATRDAGQQSFDDVQEALAARLAETQGERNLANWLSGLRSNAAIIPLEKTDEWSAWTSYEDASALIAARERAFQEVIAVVEGRQVDGSNQFRVKMQAQTSPPLIRVWGANLEPQAFEEMHGKIAAQGFQRVQHQEFTDAEGKARRQGVWQKEP